MALQPPCPSGKLPFWSKREAEDEAAKLNLKAAHSAARAVAFKCTRCPNYHVGRQWSRAFSHQQEDQG